MSNEMTVIVPLAVRLTERDDGTFTIQWVDLSDDDQTMAYDENEQPLDLSEAGLAMCEAEAHVMRAFR